MERRLTRVPFFVLLMAIGAASMMLPAIHALVREDWLTSRTFLYAAILGLMLSLLIGLATANYRPASVPRSQLSALLAAFTVLPVMFAVPFHEALGTTSFLNAWFEMVSSFTTTGATVYDNVVRLNDSLHLWRALVGWLGGLLVWVTAVSILAPMNLGGFEVRAPSSIGPGGMRLSQITRVADPSERLVRYTERLLPVYVGLTGLLWLGLVAAGDRPFVAFCHAMSTLATSGISPLGGLGYDSSGFLGEALILLFSVFALSRLTFARNMFGDQGGRLLRDPELRMGLALVLIVPGLLFMRHFFGAVEDRVTADLPQAAAALWGALFTVGSFLTTTGFESRYWLGAADWSGLETPGLILVGVALIGGGVATTAGGVKLLRVYALWMHGKRELERLVHPHSVGGDGIEARRIRREGAFISWIFFMLFALSVTGVMLALSLTGVQFEVAMTLTVAALSTTGPLAEIGAQYPISYAGIPDAAKVVLAFAMVLGRLETLAIIALLNPAGWRS
ncbi:trk system potassium uptake protein TrkH [Limimaricola variabilis]|jgi:trk system potassium uptake protein TrkH|uniref:Trk system potassium uptake protein TrkH n=1 Tax=Limimaricola variabilis TaxID=1492771 RepID=A0ABR6HJF9_9RHOB|nr:TrkH family potassium uptake protein [Limimaricola variabilis]MBB3710679.1 trk system potassium uptake protein TrkH [Limimaricola variabilis]WPY95212.1 TrkH family potassium uptake protein [Limimaricola variabilis]